MKALRKAHPEISHPQRWPRGALLLWLAVSVAVIAALMIGETGTALSHRQYAGLVSILMTPVALALYIVAARRRPLLQFVLTPAGLVLGYLWVSMLSVPLLWVFQFATPWPSFPSDLALLILLSGCGLTAIASLGAAVGRPDVIHAPLLQLRGRPVLSVFMATIALLAAAAFVRGQVGGFSYLLTNLLSKRDLLAGLGPFTALAATGAVASVFVAQLHRPSKPLVAMAILCGCIYTGYLFVLGSRFPMIAFLLAPIVARAAQGRPPRKALVLVLSSIIPFSVWYSVAVRRGQVLSEGGPGITETIRRVLDPFAYGGLDVIHTFGTVVAAPNKVLGIDIDIIVSNILTMVPRTLWPGKPPGLSTEFSAQYFPAEWSRGSGVPPSILAELPHLYGIAGACVAALVLGYVLSWLGGLLLTSHGLFARLLYPFLTVDCIVLAKSGSEAFFQQASLHLVACFLFVVILKATGTSVRMESHNESSQAG